MSESGQTEGVGLPKACGHERGNEGQCSVKRAAAGSHQSPKQKQQEFADTTVSNESVFRCQILNSSPHKSSHELKIHKVDGILFLGNRFITYHVKSPTTTFSP